MVSLENLVARTLMMMVAHADIYLYSSVSSRFRCSYLRLFLTPNLINDDEKKKKRVLEIESNPACGIAENITFTYHQVNARCLVGRC